MKNKDISKTVQASFEEQKGQSRPSKALPSSSLQIRLPTQRPTAQISSKKRRTTQQVTKEWNTEVTHTDQMSSHFPPSSEAARDLSPKRVQRFHQKKTKAILQKMTDLHEETKHKKSKKVSFSSSQKQFENDRDELWRDMMKPHEERHFQIGRITNYFS